MNSKFKIKDSHPQGGVAWASFPRHLLMGETLQGSSLSRHLLQRGGNRVGGFPDL
ncbi:MAG: hypothetical protein KME23_29390 [Goleter apudmare HA4340-LM2]|nr:hypothetical protein [Goleter apudmare HA4340-LM2]